jgi:hypothetical protein
MAKLGIAAVILAAAGLSCGVEAWAADTMPVKTPPAVTASAPKTCTDGRLAEPRRAVGPAIRCRRLIPDPETEQLGAVGPCTQRAVQFIHWNQGN